MKIVVAGATGFLGSALATALIQRGHDLVVLSRRPGRTTTAAAGRRTVEWDPGGAAGAWTSEIEGAGAVVNLAGEPIAGRRWTPAQKHRILQSRVSATRLLADAIADAAAPPPVFVSASGVGFYGPCGDELVTELHPAGDDFLARVCHQWEAAARLAMSARTRVVRVRTGLVLAKEGGALPRMLPPFRLGLGGPLGSGQQYWPWIHLVDWVALVTFAIERDDVDGALNATGPEPVTNLAFTRALGRALRRPTVLPAPAFALRLLLGEMADGLLLSGQRAVPAAALHYGFTFQHDTIDHALRFLSATRSDG
ncbi:MAG: TIGR01777 family oxidoreductase [Vicinamibacterales bacterium]